MNLETKITIYKFTPQVFTLTRSGLNGKEVAEERILTMLLFGPTYFYCSKYSSDMSYLWNIFFYLYSH